MANIKKNFNFRNGVQVDDDNLLVTATGLVGIGTTVPTEALDVRGNVKVVGDATITNATIGILTLTEVAPTQIIGAGVSIKSGIVTAQGAGIVTFYGDARFLQGMPTSQWEDTNAGFGVSSIYNTGGTVGIATTNPKSTLQIGDNPDLIGGFSGRGVGISSVGNINASGIISATTFKGSLTGDVTGNVVGVVTGSLVGNVTGNVTGNINSSGISTLTTGIVVTGLEPDTDNGAYLGTNAKSWSSLFVDSIGIDGRTIQALTGDLDLNSSTGSVTLKYANTTPKLETASSGVNIVGTTTTGQLSVTGVSTFSGIIEASAGQNKIPFLYSSMTDLPSAGSYHGAVAHVHATGSLYYAHAGNWWELVNKESDGRVGTGTEVYNVASINASGIITAATELNTPLIGVGTDSPVCEIQVRKTGRAEIQVTSDTGIAALTIGREPGFDNTNNAEFRFGGGSGANYSSDQSLDLINYDIGNFNYHLSAANAGNVDGDFHWHKGINNSTLMTLTGIGGSLGIGITTPDSALHVLGQAKISGNVVLGGDLDVTGNAALNVIGQVTGDLTGNVNATTGVSTFKRLDLDTTSYYEFGELSASGVGIGTTMGNFKLVINQDADKRLTVSDSGNVGIKTDETFGNGLYVNGSLVSNTSIAIGSTQPTSAVDFKNAGQGGVGANANRMYMLPPQVNTSQRAALQGVVSGAVIYNTSLNKLQVYVGSGAYDVANWQNCN